MTRSGVRRPVRTFAGAGALAVPLPVVGDAALSQRVQFHVSVLSPATRAQSGAAVRIRRKQTASGGWTQ